MVKGLELFRDHFSAFSDRYVLIGGTACDLILNEAGVEFRVTKDLDIVLCLETIDAEFARKFWTFVKAGGYEAQETSEGDKRFYRFKKPTNGGYPTMLELFCRVPDALKIAGGGELTPIPIDETVSSLSAILLDDVYYRWIQDGKRVIDGVPVVGPEHLIPLKAKAWLDLRDRNAAGQKVDSKDIKKHRNDVFRLFAVINPEYRATLEAPIAADMRRFFEEIPKEELDLKGLGLGSRSLDSILTTMRTIYGISS